MTEMWNLLLAGLAVASAVLAGAMLVSGLVCFVATIVAAIQTMSGTKPCTGLVEWFKKATETLALAFMAAFAPVIVSLTWWATHLGR